MKSNIRCRPWKKATSPKRILVVRFQALGDTLITLPYLQALKDSLPDTEIHFLTREEVAPIPKAADFFDRVITIGGKRNAKVQFILTMLKIPFLSLQGYDFILDLQNNRISRWVRRLLLVNSWSEFDSSSPISAGERTRLTINAGGFCDLTPSVSLRFNPAVAVDLFAAYDIRPEYDFIILNPAGYCPSRSWPLNFYTEFALQWLQKVNSKTYFVLLLLPDLSDKAAYIQAQLGQHCIDLTGRANQVQAMQIVKAARLMLTEDSGLMHMAWIQSVPTIALFSSSRKDWSAPQGEFSICLDSSDLECGPCMREVCLFNDNRCLTRYTPAFVLSKAIALYSKFEAANV